LAVAMSPGSVPAKVIKRSVTIDGHRTSVSLEGEFWDEIKRIAALKGCSVSRLIAEVDREREGNLSSAIRIFVLRAARSGKDEFAK